MTIDGLKRRWEKIQDTVLELRNLINLLEDMKNLYKNLGAFRQELEDVRAWEDKMLRDAPSNNQLIHLRNKIRHVKQHEMKLKELNAQSIILLTKPLPGPRKHDIEEDIKRTNAAYEELVLRLTNREVQLKLQLKQAPERRDRFQSLQTKVQDIESQIISEHAMLSHPDPMRDKLRQLQQLRADLLDLQSACDDVARERRAHCDKGSLEDLSLRSSLEDLVTRFEDTKTILQQKIDKLESGESVGSGRWRYILNSNEFYFKNIPFYFLILLLVY